MNAATNEMQTAIRLPVDLVERIDALAKRADGLAEFAVSRPTRSAVMRLALIRGVAQLEEELKQRRR
jgi:predicted DNA-binding protein